MISTFFNREAQKLLWVEGYTVAWRFLPPTLGCDLLLWTLTTYFILPPPILHLFTFCSYAVFGYYLLNTLMADGLLRLAMAERILGDSYEGSIHSCPTCYKGKIMWRLQDTIAATIHLVLGWFLFVFLSWNLQMIPRWVCFGLQVMWRGYLHSMYIFTRDGLCPESMVLCYGWRGLRYGLLDVCLDWLMRDFGLWPSIQWSVCIFACFLMDVYIHRVVIDYSLIPRKPTYFSLNPIWMTWRLSQTVVLGTIQVTKRRKMQKSPIRTLASLYTEAQGWWYGKILRILRYSLLWPDHRSYRALLHQGPTAPYVRDQAITVFHTLTKIRNFVSDYDKPLLLLKGVTSAPLIGRWIRFTLDSRIKNLITLLSKIGSRKVLAHTLTRILKDMEGPLSDPFLTQTDMVIEKPKDFTIQEAYFPSSPQNNHDDGFQRVDPSEVPLHAEYFVVASD